MPHGEDRNKAGRARLALSPIVVALCALFAACASDDLEPGWVNMGPVQQYETGVVHMARARGARFPDGPYKPEILVAVVRPEKSPPVVLSLVDPHQGCRVAWRPSENEFINPCHGQMYDWAGRCIQNCSMDLLRYPSRVDEEGNLHADMSATPGTPVAP